MDVSSMCGVMWLYSQFMFLKMFIDSYFLRCCVMHICGLCFTDVNVYVCVGTRAQLIARVFEDIL